MRKNKTKEKQVVLPLRKKQASIFSKSKYFIFAFFIPFFIMAIAYALQGVYPFGDKHILTIDLYHQYTPFLRELRSKILSGDSLFYTWTGGMGFNFFAVFTYYLASPYNLLLLLFKQELLSDAVFLITVLKIASSGLAFYLYAHFTNNKHSWFYVALASSYALSGYSLAYSWNIMWLDTIVLLPICILGLIYLIRNERVWLYLVSLALILMTNYYMAFFVCFFLIFYYFVLYIKENNKFNFSKKKSNYALFSFLKFVFSSLLAVGISAITLFPTIKALMLTSASGDVFPSSIDFFESFIDFLSRLLTLAPLSIREGMPNLYAGVILLLLLPLYFINKKISKEEKISHAFLLAILLLSLNNNVLNFIWHGFHYPNQLPYRNSFVLIFLLLSMAITVYNKWDASVETPWYKLFAFWLIALLLLEKIDNKTYSVALILVSLTLLAIYSLVLTLGQDPKIKKSFISLILLSVIVIELIINSAIAINSINTNEYYGSREGYLAGERPESIMRCITDIEEDSPNARAALWPDKSVNDPMLYGFPGLTIFASTYPEIPVQFFNNLGYDNNGINSYQNTGSNIVLDSIFGLKYKITDADRQEQVSFYHQQNADGITVLHQNAYALPLLYYLPSQIGNLYLSENLSSFDNQRSLIQAMGGDKDILLNINYQIGNTVGCSVQEKAKNKYTITENSTAEGQKSFTFEFTAAKEGAYTIAWDTSNLKFDQVYLNKLMPARNQVENSESNSVSDISSENYIQENLSRKQSSLADIGYLAEGEQASLTFHLSSDNSTSGDLVFEANYINQELFASWNEELKESAVDPVRHKANQLSANIKAPNHGYILFSTTYDKGWQIKVNSEKVEAKSLDSALILIPVQKGDNYIEMKFVPQGFTAGLIVSSISLLLALVLFCYVKKQKSSGKSLVQKKKLAHESTESDKVKEDFYIRKFHLDDFDKED